MTTVGRAVLAGVITAALAAVPSRAEPISDRVLYFTHSAGYRHEVLPLSREILKGLGESSGAFALAATEDVSAFAPENLRRYDEAVWRDPRYQRLLLNAVLWAMRKSPDDRR